MKAESTYGNDTSKNKKRKLQSFLRIINYLSKFSPSTADICESLAQLTSNKTEWTWNAIYQKLFYTAKSIITGDVCMKFYDETQPLYMEKMYLKLDSELPYFKPEAVQAAQETKH